MSESALSMVYGGGGMFGIVYGVGVAHGLMAAGLPVGTAPALGTSAGSWVASSVALGITRDDVEHIRPPAIPCAQRGVLADIAREIWGESTHHLVSVSAVCLRTRRRHILNGADYPLADLVAASSAVPGLLPPHTIGDRRYIDGGMWSATSVDAATNAHRVIVVAPLAGSILGPIGRGAGFLLQRELQSWRRANPTHDIRLIRPTSQVARLAGSNPLGLFDRDRAWPVYPLAYEQGLRVGTEILEQRAA